MTHPHPEELLLGLLIGFEYVGLLMGFEYVGFGLVRAREEERERGRVD